MCDVDGFYASLKYCLVAPVPRAGFTVSSFSDKRNPKLLKDSTSCNQMSPSPKCTVFFAISVRKKQKIWFCAGCSQPKNQENHDFHVFFLLKNNKIRTPLSLGCFCSSRDLLLTRYIFNNWMSFIEETWGFRKSPGGVLPILAYTGRPSSFISDYFPSSRLLK